MQMKILDIKHQPRWKFWKVDQWEVTVKVDGKTKKVSIYCHRYTGSKLDQSLFLGYVKKKVLYGNQFYLPPSTSTPTDIIGREIST